MIRYTWKWHDNSGAQQFNADGTYANYNLNFPAELNPLWSGKYTVEGNKVSLDVGGSATCDTGALWVWEVKDIDSEHIKLTVLEDGCPEAGGDSTGQTFTWRACALEIPEQGKVTCGPIEG